MGEDSDEHNCDYREYEHAPDNFPYIAQHAVDIGCHFRFGTFAEEGVGNIRYEHGKPCEHGFSSSGEMYGYPCDYCGNQGGIAVYEEGVVVLLHGGSLLCLSDHVGYEFQTFPFVDFSVFHNLYFFNWFIL